MVGCLTTFLALAHEMLVALSPLHSVTTKHVPRHCPVFLGSRMAPTGNRWSRVAVGIGREHSVKHVGWCLAQSETNIILMLMDVHFIIIISS